MIEVNINKSTYKKMELRAIQLQVGSLDLDLGLKPILIKGESYESIQFGDDTIVLVQIKIRSGSQELNTTIPFRQCPGRPGFSDVAAQMWRPFVCVSHRPALRPIYFGTDPSKISYFDHELSGGLPESEFRFHNLRDFMNEPLASTLSQQNKFVTELDPPIETMIHSMGTLINLIISACLLGGAAWDPSFFLCAYGSANYHRACALQALKIKLETFVLTEPMPEYIPGFKYIMWYENLRYSGMPYRPRRPDPQKYKDLNWILMTHGVLFPHYQEVSRRMPMDALFVEIHRLLQEVSERMVESEPTARNPFRDLKARQLPSRRIEECFSGTKSGVTMYG